MDHGIILQNSNDTVLQILSEIWSAAALDSGASSTVYGAQWFNKYTESLFAQGKSEVTYKYCSKPVRFGDGKQFVASKVATIPANTGPQKVGIKTCIVNANIPLLLLKSAM